MEIVYNSRKYQTDSLTELLDDCKSRIRRFVLTKDVGANIAIDMPEYHRHHADGVVFGDGTVVLFCPIDESGCGVKVYKSEHYIRRANPEYDIHWLDIREGQQP